MTARLVVIGIDAGDPGFIERWVDEGHLPAIGSVMLRGSWASTGGSELVSEHGTWTSVFSGVSRARHGYHYFRQLRPGSYDLETALPPYEDAPPFWTRLARAGAAVGVIDAPDTRIIPGLRGIQLVNWATHTNWDPERFRPASDPPALLSEVSARFAERLSVAERTGTTSEEDRAIKEHLLEQVAIKGELCHELLTGRELDLIVTVFSESHTANHQFWRYGPGVADRPDPDEADLEHAIRDIYAAIDGEIGRLLSTLGPDANVVVVSSVGMEDDFPTGGTPEAVLREFGYEVPAAAGAPTLRPLDLARRLLPERWRVALSRNLSRERRERLLADGFRTRTDWSRTTAFAVPSAYTSFIRVNLRGREPRGIVEPGRPYAELLDRLEADFLKLLDPVSGERAVRKTHRSRDFFGKDCHPALPDLFVEWKPGRYMDRLVFPGGEIRPKRPEFFRRSNHSAHGFVAAAGPAVEASGRLPEMDVLDLAPTFLALLGRDPSPRMVGRAAPWARARESD